MSIVIRVISLLLVLTVQGVHAADTLREEPITVTATRFSSSLSDAAVNVTVINADDIAKSGAGTLAELLGQQAGMQVSDLFGISGARARLDAGGFGASGGLNTLVLLNGRRLNDVDLTGADLAAIPLAAIARVEILHGSGTVLYGDNAAGGVINILTKTGFTGPAGTVEARAGTYGTNSIGASINAGNAANAATVTAQGLDSDGYRARSSFSHRNLFAEASHLDGDMRYGVRVTGSSETTQFPGALGESLYLANPRTSTYYLTNATQDEQSIEAFLSGKNLAGEIALRTKSQSSRVFGDVAADLETLSFTPRYTTALFGQTLIAGIDFYRSTLDTTALFPGMFPAANAGNIRRDSLAAYLTDAIPLGRGFTLHLGARRQAVNLDMTNIDMFGSTVTGAQRSDALTAWDTTLAWRQGGTRAYLRAGESFRFPVLDELWSYYYGTIAFLRPQHGQNFEIGVRQALAAGTLEANAFHMLLKDEIGYNAATYSNENFDPTRHDGFNLGWRMPLGKQLEARLGYTYRDARFRAGTYDGKAIPEIPRNSVVLGATWQVAARQQFGLNGAYTGARYFGDDLANAGKTMSPHTLWNLHYTYAPESWKLRAAIINVMNVKTADIGYYASWLTNPYTYYPLPERALMFSAEKSF
jgi:iron complex outermembrane receptor protein